MPISAIDASTVAPRSVEASTMVGKEQQQLQHVGENGAVTFEKNNVQDMQRTVETKRSETEEYDYDDSESSGRGGGQRRKKRNKKQGEAPMAPRSNSSFDIMI